MTQNPSPHAFVPPSAPNGQAPSTALARRQNEDLFKFGLEPQGFTEAMALCEQIAKTGMFSGAKDGTPLTASSLLVRLMVGRSLGVPSMIALVHVFDVYGRPSISARLKVALCLRHPDCERFELLEKESDATSATYIVKRAGREEKRFRYTVDDAKIAGTWKAKGNWETIPRRMCEARASSWGADVEFPDACMGMPTVDEAEDYERPGEMRGEVVPQAVLSQAQTRDWEKESAAIMIDMEAAVDANNQAAMKAVRARYKAFCEEAPGAFGDSLKAAYNKLKESRTAPTTGTGTTKPAATTQTQATPSTSKSGYLPPEQRGDTYDGPLTPPIPFGAS